MTRVSGQVSGVSAPQAHVAAPEPWAAGERELRAGRPCDRWHDGMLFRSLLLCQELEGEREKKKEKKTIIIVREKNQDKTLAFSDDPRPSGWVSSGTAGTAAGDTAIARTSFI